MPVISGNRAIESAVVAWVMELERAARQARIDRRFEKAFSGDIESPRRIIEVKSSYG